MRPILSKPLHRHYTYLYAKARCFDQFQEMKQTRERDGEEALCNGRHNELQYAPVCTEKHSR